MRFPAIPILILGSDPRLSRTCADVVRELSGASTEVPKLLAGDEVQWSAYSVIFVQLDDVDATERMNHLSELRKRAPQARLMTLTAQGTISEAVEAMRLGCEDYLALPMVADVLKAALGRVLGELSTDTSDPTYSRNGLSLAYIDEHTGLPNSRHLSVYIDSLVHRYRSGESKTEFTLLFVDIDHFKAINDRFGHLAGNSVLKQFGIFLRKTLREGDRIFRYAGDEFVIIVESADRTSLKKVIDRLRDSLQVTPFHIVSATKDPVSIHLEISVGSVHFPEESHSREDLLARADSRLYVEKRGKNQLWNESLPG